MKFTPTEIADVIVLEPEVHGDNRGFFMESWREAWSTELPGGSVFLQDNLSKSVQGTLRGLHYQVNQPQGKYLRVLSGEVFDVAVDLREGSETFGKWIGINLSEDNKKGIWVPPGFAHGFYVMSETAEIMYKCTAYYSAGDERCLLWNDKELGIKWPIIENTVLLSVKDQEGIPFSLCDKYS